MTFSDNSFIWAIIAAYSYGEQGLSFSPFHFLDRLDLTLDGKWALEQADLNLNPDSTTDKLCNSGQLTNPFQLPFPSWKHDDGRTVFFRKLLSEINEIV